MKSGFLPITAALVLMAFGVRAETTFKVQPDSITDQKAVYATVESPYVVPARTRIGGTVASLSVRQGDLVTPGQVVAVVADEKLLLQINSLDAEISGLQSTLAQAKIDLNRAETLARQGAGPRATMDQARTALEVATSMLQARTAQRSVAQQTLEEGRVLAPVAGRVLTVPLTNGTVVMNGDTVATIGEQPFRLRLRIPERHAVEIKVGDPIRLDAKQLGTESGGSGTLTLIYPRIEEGRVVADANVSDLGDYFVGDRVRVWINAGTRSGFVVPESFVNTRFGLDYVSLRQADGSTIEAPVQRGQDTSLPSMPDGLELLSGVRAGDVLVRP
ncbi:MAG TPA: efflux RND transporter periplasmic adaptor subunit [Acetobacteraceae bacterium]|jgi:RND family efflux transporter MFP subunit|nr:efflux RND transporter periplasmic adaptor subunit [Acetobacteraceae bacterium]